ncbi:MAG: hypothetical protein ABI669_12815, partial [Usitatibacter sp.]
MRALIWRAAMAGIFLLAGTAANAAFYGVNPFNNDNTTLPGTAGLFTLDESTGAITAGTVVSVPARTITGLLGITLDPTTGTVYAIAKANAVVGRLLITLDVTTGAGIEIGNLGDQFSSIAFRADGQLFGVTGDGAAVSETLFTINKATAVPILATALGAGNDGEVIAFNYNDGRFYHWSGNSGAINFERVLATAPFTVTPITIGSGTNEVFGAVWNGALNQFMVHNIDSIMAFWSTAGVVTSPQPATVEDVRGMVLAYSVTPSAGANGTVPAPRLAASGQQAVFTLSPNPGFAAASVGGTCGGTLVGNT